MEKRKNHRATLNFTLKLAPDKYHATETNFSHDENDGYAINFSPEGICLLTKERIEIGTTIKINSTFDNFFKDFSFRGRIIWCRDTSRGFAYGINLIYPDKKSYETVEQKFTIINSAKRMSVLPLRVILGIGIPFIPLLSLYFYFRNPSIQFSLPFSLFINMVILERFWETFITTKEFAATQDSYDWTINAVSFYYILMLIFVILEFFLVPKIINNFLVISGSSLFILAALIRFICVRTLSTQWAVHAVNRNFQVIKENKIIKKGLYKYIRHPIYLGVILEIISIPLICNAFYSLIFVILVNVPLQILRSKMEDTTNINIFGEEYIYYMKSTPSFIPNIFHIS